MRRCSPRPGPDRSRGRVPLGGAWPRPRRAGRQHDSAAAVGQLGDGRLRDPGRRHGRRDRGRARPARGGRRRRRRAVLPTSRSAAARPSGSRPAPRCRPAPRPWSRSSRRRRSTRPAAAGPARARRHRARCRRRASSTPPSPRPAARSGGPGATSARGVTILDAGPRRSRRRRSRSPRAPACRSSRVHRRPRVGRARDRRRGRARRARRSARPASPTRTARACAALVEAAGGEPQALGIAKDRLEDVESRLCAALAGERRRDRRVGRRVGRAVRRRQARVREGRPDRPLAGRRPARASRSRSARPTRPDGGQRAAVRPAGQPGLELRDVRAVRPAGDPGARRPAAPTGCCGRSTAACCEEPVSKSPGRRGFLRVDRRAGRRRLAGSRRRTAASGSGSRAARRGRGATSSRRSPPRMPSPSSPRRTIGSTPAPTVELWWLDAVRLDAAVRCAESGGGMAQKPPRNERRRLTHVDRSGRPRMVDVSDKPVTARRATAEALVAVSPETMSLVIDGGGPKGDVLGVAELAGVMAGKRTCDLIPLCHPLPLTDLVVAVTPDRAAGVLRVRAEAATTGPDRRRDGGADRGLGGRADDLRHGQGRREGRRDPAVRLVSKTGGKSGDWHRPPRRPTPGRRADRSPATASPGGSAPSGRRRPTPMSGRSALVLTASDRGAAGEREDTSGDGVAERLAGARLQRRARGRRRRPAGDRGRPEGRRGPPPARRHDRRHRPDAARRDAPGDARGDRLRGARASPRRCAPPGARRRRMADLSRAVVGVRAGQPDREPAGQPQGRAGVARGDRAGARPRARDARRAVRPRGPHAGSARRTGRQRPAGDPRGRRRARRTRMSA